VKTTRKTYPYGKQVINGLAAFALLLAGASSAAGASCVPDTDVPTFDAKVFPGAKCRQLGTSSTVRYDNNGRVLNPSTTSLVTVICPIVRDASTERWLAIDVVVGDRSSQNDVSCTAISAQKDGLYGGFNPETQKSIGFNPEWWKVQTLHFGSQSQERDYGTYFLSCTIPPRYSDATGSYESGIYSYSLHEFSGCTNPN
jgi:hypothetical protein